MRDYSVLSVANPSWRRFVLLEIVVSLKGTRDVELPSFEHKPYCPSSLSDAVFSHILSVAVRDCGSQFLDISTELLSFLQLLLQPLGAQPVLPLLSYWRGSCCRQIDRHVSESPLIKATTLIAQQSCYTEFPWEHGENCWAVITTAKTKQ